MKVAALVLFCAFLVPCLGNTTYEFAEVDNGLKFTVNRDNGALSKVAVLNGILRMDSSTPTTEKPLLEYSEVEDLVYLTWESNDTSISYKDCFELIGDNNQQWWGGPERFNQVPVTEMTVDNTAWVLKSTDNFAVIEPYWLSSNGVFIHVDPTSALYVDQNSQEPGKLCLIAKVQGPYVGRDKVKLRYAIGTKDNPKEAHLHAVNNLLKKPTGHPNERMIREPIWTTWAKYKTEITDEIVVKFAEEISSKGYAGQLEIDDFWEPCYGDQHFDPATFGNITQTVATLHDLGFRVTLWVQPFINLGCDPNAQEGLDKGYFVLNDKGESNATWWDGVGHQIDFTNEQAQEWYLARLNNLKELHGIDSFKFDAGETDFVNQPAVYPNADINLVPNVHSESYIRTCAKMGDLIEVRSAWKTQDLPIFVRMLDKDSRWGLDNGLHSLITTLLQMNMNGYVMVLPDMIGGNGYTEKPDAELLVRWAQANVFMPSMQFSYLPWDLQSEDFDTEYLIRKTVDLHTRYADTILEAMQAAIDNGTPVNPPIWWVDPQNAEAHQINDEYLLGESILVAPVIEKGAQSRDVYLPDGAWIDGNLLGVYQGPAWLMNYTAPIDVLPYFIRV